MSATVEFTVNPVDNQSSVLFFVSFFKKSSVKSSTDLVQWPNYPEGSIPVKASKFYGGES
jgi:hypothetical protein